MSNTKSPRTPQAFEAALQVETSGDKFMSKVQAPEGAGWKGTLKYPKEYEISFYTEGARWSRDYTTRDVLKNHPVVVAMAEALESCAIRLMYFETLPDSEAMREHAKPGREKATAVLAAYRESVKEKT